MDVLIVRLGAFGDIIHTLPLAVDLHRAGHRVHWLCEERWRQIIAGSPAVHQIHGIPRRAGMAAQRTIARRLRRTHAFDAVIDAQGLAKSAWWLWALSSPIRIGFRRGRAREGAWLLSNRRVSASCTHVIDQQRCLGLGLGLGLRPQGPAQWLLPAWDQQNQWAQQWLQEQDLSQPYALNVGAGWPSKVWPEDYQRSFLQLLAMQGQRPLIIWGSPAEYQLAQQLHAQVPDSVLAPDTDIPRLAGILRHCRALVSGDTGPLHLAAACDCPTVGLFGPVPAERNGPRGRQHHNLQASAPAWERKRADLVDWSQLTPERVLATAQMVASQPGRKG